MAHKPLQRATLQRRGHADDAVAAQGTTQRLHMPPPNARDGPGNAADAVSAEPRIPNADRLFRDTDDRDQPAERPTSRIYAVVTTSSLQERRTDPDDLTGLAQQAAHRVRTARSGRQLNSGSPRAGLDDSGAHKAHLFRTTRGQQVPLDDQLQTEGALTQACFGCGTTLLAQTSYEFPHCPAGNAFRDIVHNTGHFQRSHTEKKQSTGVTRHPMDSNGDKPRCPTLTGTDDQHAVVGLDLSTSSVSMFNSYDAHWSLICRTSVEDAMTPLFGTKVTRTMDHFHITVSCIGRRATACLSTKDDSLLPTPTWDSMGPSSLYIGMAVRYTNTALADSNTAYQRESPLPPGNDLTVLQNSDDVSVFNTPVATPQDSSTPAVTPQKPQLGHSSVAALTRGSMAGNERRDGHALSSHEERRPLPADIQRATPRAQDNDLAPAYPHTGRKTVTTSRRTTSATKRLWTPTGLRSGPPRRTGRTMSPSIRSSARRQDGASLRIYNASTYPETPPVSNSPPRSPTPVA